MTALASNIAAIRRRWGMSQAAFGALLGASRSQASNWERGRSAPAFEDMLLLAKITGLNADTLHSSELPYVSIPPAPLSDTPPVAPVDPIVLELKRINEQLADIKTMLSNLIP